MNESSILVRVNTLRSSAGGGSIFAGVEVDANGARIDAKEHLVVRAEQRHACCLLVRARTVEVDLAVQGGIGRTRLEDAQARHVERQAAHRLECDGVVGFAGQRPIAVRTALEREGDAAALDFDARQPVDARRQTRQHGLVLLGRRRIGRVALLGGVKGTRTRRKQQQ